MTFNKYPSIKAVGEQKLCVLGWPNIANQLKQGIDGNPGAVIVVETYQGTFLEEIIDGLSEVGAVVDTRTLFKPEEEILSITLPDVTEDRVFGKISGLSIDQFLDLDKCNLVRDQLKHSSTITIVIGPGASRIAVEHDVFLYADMARWEIQQRMRANEVPNLGLVNHEDLFERKYKIGYFVDWRICDRIKVQTMASWDYVLDTNKPNEPKMAHGKTITKTIESAAKQPFSVVPFFDPGPWGGQWMKEVCELDKENDNYAWCFNCVPEENSLLIEFENTVMELPSINVVFQQPKELLGKNVYDQFGAEFPIRFDFLDTIEGGNLSLQVHPLTEYIKEQFDMDYTQDESYYIMDASEDAKVYLGLKDDIEPAAMMADLRKAQATGEMFNADKYAKSWSAKKHDHFLIPAGTVHCSAKGCMVLEISATPYIFTFKLWDWGRLGMDGKPRPINIDHGEQVIQWDRTPEWTQKNLINNVVELSSNGVYREEKTGLHELEFIETRRFWFNKITQHNTEGTVQVICLIEGDQIIIESPENQFESLTINYAEVFIVPAAVGDYTIRPAHETDKELAIIKAYIR